MTRSERIQVVLAVSTAVLSSVGLYVAVLAHQRAEQLELMRAKNGIIDRVIDMSAHARNRADDEVVALAQHLEVVADHYGQDRLDLAPTLYRQAAEHVVIASSDLDLGEVLISRAIRQIAKNRAVAVQASTTGCPYVLAAEPDALGFLALELIHTYRVQADLAAQRLRPAALAACEDEALRISGAWEHKNPLIGTQAARFTRAYKVALSLLGASRSTGPAERSGFCAIAADEMDREGDAVRTVASTGEVRSVLARIGNGHDTLNGALHSTCGYG